MAVLALLSSSTVAGSDKSMIALATEDDQIAEGASKWNKDVGYIQQSDKNEKDDEGEEIDDQQNVSISSLNKQKNKISREKEAKAAQIRDEINEKESSQQNKQLFASINEKLQDKTFIEMAVQTSMKKEGVTHTQEYEEYEPNSSDLGKKDFGGRHTDQMGEWEKDYEDNYNQGGMNTNKGNEIKNQPKHTIDGSWDKFGPTNIPKHMQRGDFKPATAATGTKSGIVLVYLTVDNDEHATRVIKGLFNKKLIAAANQYEGNFERTYLKLGRMSTEQGRDKIELTTTADKVAALIDYINNNNPTDYDYPVPDIFAIPVETGNEKWISFVKKSVSGDDTLHEEAGHGDEDHEGEHHHDEDHHDE